LDDHIKKTEMGWACSTYGGAKKETYRVLMGKPQGRRLLERPRHRWVDNNKINIREVGRGAWTGLV
jgi:hypothetical protein